VPCALITKTKIEERLLSRKLSGDEKEIGLHLVTSALKVVQN